jgi:PAS domain S-box-containing protein
MTVSQKRLRDVDIRDLQRQKVFFESLFENAPAIVLILDEHGRITRVNPYFESLTGYSSDDLVGRNWFDTCLPREDRDAIRALFERVLRDGTNAGHVNPIVTKNGELRHIEWFAQSLIGSDGLFEGLLNIGYDVTRRIEHEREVEAARREAERANATKSRFLVTASHDLRQPLQTLLLLNASLKSIATEARQLTMLEMQDSALKSMGQLLNTLLDIGKLESGTIKPKIVDVPVCAIFRAIDAEFGAQARAKGIQLTVDDSEIAARTDAALLEQLLSNLVANAIRYTRSGVVRLECHAEGDRLTIGVTDTGIGIPEDQREAIFDEFYQIDRDASNGGLGLGLSIVKRIAALLHAELRLQSEIGKGSTFSVTLARGDGDGRTQAALSSSRQRKSSGTVLLVDDDANVLAASKLFLEIEGFDVVAAASPREAYTAVATGTPAIDLIITDFQLNDADTGLDMVEAVRRRLQRTVPAILVTGDTSPSAGRAALAALQTMSKPIDTDRLLAVAGKLMAETGRDD